MILRPKDYADFITQSITPKEASNREVFDFNAFPDVDKILEEYPAVFSELTDLIKANVKNKDGICFIDSIDQPALCSYIDNKFSKNACTMFEILYWLMRNGHSINFGNISKISAEKLCQFAAFWNTNCNNSIKINATKNRDFIAAMNVLKESFFKRTFKEFYILQTWLITWAKYLLKETTFNPIQLPHYKQGDIIRVDFGWRIGSELGGIHYAIVLEKNNHPKNPMIFIVPISSYKLGWRVHFNDVDLGQCIGDKCSYAVLSQMGSYSKMRILEERVYRQLPKDQLSQILNKLAFRLAIKPQPK